MEDDISKISKEIEEIKAKYRIKKIITFLSIILIIGGCLYFYLGTTSNTNPFLNTQKNISSQPETESNLPPLPPSRSSQVSENNISEELPPPEPPREPENFTSEENGEGTLPPLPPSRQ
ncbi:MAG: hypothetical protein B6U88_00455 [Candidatus Aenigmarchaeota archaeon ex4484_56]|nr:MAG: hypothetical protein B6U88_00455 [Candidatus Aenigmarchaeota archaeon ex4484_56]